MDRFDIEGTVTCYGYRTARVSDIICRLGRSLCWDLEQKLAEKAGVKPDNHVVYKLEQQYRSVDPIYIWMSDHSVTFAKNVEEYPNGY